MGVGEAHPHGLSGADGPTSHPMMMLMLKFDHGRTPLSITTCATVASTVAGTVAAGITTGSHIDCHIDGL